MSVIISIIVAIIGAIWTALKVVGPTWKKIAVGVGVALVLLFIALCLNFGFQNVFWMLMMMGVCTYNPHCMS